MDQFLITSLFGPKIEAWDSDKILMSQKKLHPWMSPFGLSSSNFADMPKGENPLHWGLKNSVVNEEEYVHWASGHYQLPSIQGAFFSMAVDIGLADKLTDVFAWSSTCYPVYQWEDVTYVACLEPPQNMGEGNFCFMVAPFSAMESAWAKHKTQDAPQNEAEPAAPVEAKEAQETSENSEIQESPYITEQEFQFSSDVVEPAPEDQPEKVEEKQEAPAAPETADLGALDFSSMAGTEAEAETPTTEKVEEKQEAPAAPETADLGALDFSSMAGAEAASEQAEAQEPAETPAASQEEEITQTKIDGSFDAFTTATQTMHARPDEGQLDAVEIPNVEFDKVSTGGIQLENEQTNTQLKNKSKEVPAPPVAEEPQEFTHTPPFPPVENEKVNQTSSQPIIVTEDGLVDDDYTPVPEMAESQIQAKKQQQRLEVVQPPGPQTGLIENTITDHNQPVYTPKENLITDQDFSKYANLDGADNIKGVVAHFFSHLKKDYKKLMWVDRSQNDLYFPKFVYGDWKMTELSWKMHVNLANPNMFRIAHKSGHPFHGEVAPNPYNDKYYEWWCRGKEPDFVTIYPVIYREEIQAFVVGFEKAEDFDELGSLKKIENLISICKKTIKKFRKEAAAA